jgi:trk system potassium uptake protein TrkA
MKVVICGAGQVGFGIADRLSREGNDVSVIDTSARLIQSITEQLEVRGIVGHGAHPDVLAQAGAKEADLLIAVTLYDEVNMIACQVAHALFNVPTKVARVRAQNYLAPHWRDLFAHDRLAIDVVISPEVEVGDMVLRRLALPGAVDAVNFIEDRVTVVGIQCEDDCPVVDVPLRQLTDLFPDLMAVVVAISRKGKLAIPRSDDTVQAGDLAYVVVQSDHVQRTLSIFGHDEVPAHRIVLCGGGNIGLYVAKAIETSDPRARIKLVEANRPRAVEIANQLDRVIVLNGSALDRDILEEANVAEADTMVALTNDDQVNLLSCVLARSMGAKRNLALLNNTSYPTFARGLGIDAFVNPRQVTVSRVLQHVRRGRIRAVHALGDGGAEVVEAEALETSPLVGKPLREAQIGEGVRIGAVVRRGKVIMPNGSTEIEPHDRVVLFVRGDRVRDVEQLFRVSLEFF